MARWAWVSMVLIACGGGSGGPMVTETGSGTDSLRVTARFSATPERDEQASDAAELDVDLQVDVTDATGADVTGATVTIQSRNGTVTLSEGGCERRYCGSQLGYAELYELDVRRGDDRLTGVTVSGPSFHQVTSPAQGETVPADQPLVVQWAPAGEGDLTRVETRELEREMAGDPGSFEIPADSLRSRDDREEDERIRVRRERTVALTGGLPGSSIEISVRNGIEIFTERM